MMSSNFCVNSILDTSYEQSPLHRQLKMRHDYLLTQHTMQQRNVAALRLQARENSEKVKNMTAIVRAKEDETKLFRCELHKSEKELAKICEKLAAERAAQRKLKKDLEAMQKKYDDAMAANKLLVEQVVGMQNELAMKLS